MRYFASNLLKYEMTVLPIGNIGLLARDGTKLENPSVAPLMGSSLWAFLRVSPSAPCTVTDRPPHRETDKWLHPNMSG